MVNAAAWYEEALFRIVVVKEERVEAEEEVAKDELFPMTAAVKFWQRRASMPGGEGT